MAGDNASASTGAVGALGLDLVESGEAFSFVGSTKLVGQVIIADTADVRDSAGRGAVLYINPVSAGEATTQGDERERAILEQLWQHFVKHRRCVKSALEPMIPMITRSGRRLPREGRTQRKQSRSSL